MYLQKVVARPMLRFNHFTCVFRTVNAVSVKRGAGRKEPRSKHFATQDLLPEVKVSGSSQHAAGNRDSVCDVEAQYPLEIGRTYAGNVGMHFRQPRHEEPVRTIDYERIFCNGNIVHSTDRHDFPVLNNYSLCCNDGLECHWNDVDINEHRLRRRCRKHL